MPDRQTFLIVWTRRGGFDVASMCKAALPRLNWCGDDEEGVALVQSDLKPGTGDVGEALEASEFEGLVLDGPVAVEHGGLTGAEGEERDRFAVETGQVEGLGSVEDVADASIEQDAGGAGCLKDAREAPEHVVETVAFECGDDEVGVLDFLLNELDEFVAVGQVRVLVVDDAESVEVRRGAVEVADDHWF